MLHAQLMQQIIPGMRYQAGEDVSAWQEKARAKLREVLGLRPIREFVAWLEKMGIMENGRLTSRAGDPTIFTGRG